MPRAERSPGSTQAVQSRGSRRLFGSAADAPLRGSTRGDGAQTGTDTRAALRFAFWVRVLGFEFGSSEPCEQNERRDAYRILRTLDCHREPEERGRGDPARWIASALRFSQ